MATVGGWPASALRRLLPLHRAGSHDPASHRKEPMSGPGPVDADASVGWLRLKLQQGAQPHRRRVQAWLEAHPRVSRFLERGGCLHVDELTLARGLAVGLFVALTPTVGIQTLLILAGSLTFRANFVAAFLISNISNPFTIAPLYFGFNQLGQWWMDRLPITPAAVVDLGDEIAYETLAILIGSLTIAIPMAALGYFLFLALGRMLDLHTPLSLPRPDEDHPSD